MPEQESMSAVIAVLSHQMGELKEAVSTSLREIRSTLSEHGTEIGQLKEYRIRAEEREAGDDKLRAALQEDRTARDAESNNRITLSLARWQAWCAALLVVVTVASVIIAAAATFS